MATQLNDEEGKGSGFAYLDLDEIGDALGGRRVVRALIQLGSPKKGLLGKSNRKRSGGG